MTWVGLFQNRKESMAKTADAKTKQARAEAFGELKFEADEVQLLPQTTTPVAGDDVVMLDKLLATLNDLDDVQNIYRSAEPQD